MTKRVLVTGGAGFIGSHVTQVLLEQGHTVRVLDNLHSGLRDHVPTSVDFLETSVTDAVTIERAVRHTDVVVHLAAIASVPESVSNPLGTHDVNLRATIALLDAMVRNDTPRVVYASSAAVYGRTERARHSEADAPAPVTPYAADKLAGEGYLRFFADEHGLDSRSLRFFNVYGPRQDPSSPYSGVISIFLSRLLAGQELVVHGDGTQTRDFIFVSDVASVIARHVEDAASSAPSPMNVCRGHSISLLDLVATIEAITGRVARVRFDEVRAGDVRHSTGDPDRLIDWQGEAPPTDFATGLALTIDWLRSYASSHNIAVPNR